MTQDANVIEPGKVDVAHPRYMLILKEKLKASKRGIVVLRKEKGINLSHAVDLEYVKRKKKRGYKHRPRQPQ